MEATALEIVNADTAQEVAAREAGTLLQEARDLVVSTVEQAQVAADVRNEIQQRRKRIEEWFKPLVEAAHAAHKVLTAKRAAALVPFVEPQAIIDTKLGEYHAECRRQQREAAEAVERERQRLQDEYRMQAALKAEADGRPEQAERILTGQAPEPVQIVVTDAVPPPKVGGIAFAAKISVEVTDLKALARAVADGRVPPDVLTPNLTKLNALARAQGELFVAPGCRLVNATVVRRTR